METLIDVVMISFNEHIYRLVVARFKPRVLSLLKAKSLPAFKGAGMLVLKRWFLLSFVYFLVCLLTLLITLMFTIFTFSRFLLHNYQCYISLSDFSCYLF